MRPSDPTRRSRGGRHVGGGRGIHRATRRWSSCSARRSATGRPTALRAPFCIGTADELGDLLRPSFGDVAVDRPRGSGALRLARRLAAHRDPGLDARRARRRRPVRPPPCVGIRKAGEIRRRRRRGEFRGARADRHRDSGRLGRLGVPPGEHSCPEQSQPLRRLTDRHIDFEPHASGMPPGLEPCAVLLSGGTDELDRVRHARVRRSLRRAARPGGSTRPR